MESWLEMAIAMMKPIMPIVFMMEVTVVEGVSTLTNAHIVCVTMEEQSELINHVRALLLFPYTLISLHFTFPILWFPYTLISLL